MQAAETKSYFSMNKKTAYLFLINVRKNRQYNKMQKCDQSAGAKCYPHINILMQFSFWLSAITSHVFFWFLQSNKKVTNKNENFVSGLKNVKTGAGA